MGCGPFRSGHLLSPLKVSMDLKLNRPKTRPLGTWISGLFFFLSFSYFDCYVLGCIVERGRSIYVVKYGVANIEISVTASLGYLNSTHLRFVLRHKGKECLLLVTCNITDSSLNEYSDMAILLALQSRLSANDIFTSFIPRDCALPIESCHLPMAIPRRESP